MQSLSELNEEFVSFRDYLPQDALASFALGAASAYIFLKYRAHISERGTQVSDHIKDIEKLAVSAVELWTSKDDQYRKANEVQLHHTLSVQVFETIRFACHKRRPEYEELMFNLFRVTAADEFLANGSDRVGDAASEDDRVQEIIALSSALITLLRRVRADISTLEYLAWDTWRALSLFLSWVKRDLLTP